MPSNNISILLWLFKAKINKQGLAPLYLRVSYSTQRKNISTGYYLQPNKWDAVKHRAKGNQPEAAEINNYIQQTQSRLVSIYNNMLKEGDINLDNLIERFFGRDVSPHTILELIQWHNNDIQKRIGIDYTASTFEKYDILRKRMEEFIPVKYNKKDLRLKDINYDFAADFDFYLRNAHNNSQNTVVKYIKNLKRILNVGVNSKWLPEIPFKGFKATYKDVERIYLTAKELKLIEGKSFRLERLNLVRDMFVFQCYTGLAYNDMAKLTKQDVSTGLDGNQWIIIRRTKTDGRSAIPLLPVATSIIEKYRSKAGDEKLLPCYAIQKFNSYLDEIANICGIDKNLTSHVGRRTFATTIALNNGMSLEAISKILGHTSTKITQIYAVVTDHKISEEMNKLREKL
jgi:integrase